MTHDTPDWGSAFVRVTGVRRRQFVEFEFSVGDRGDRDLCVEMIMPYRAFREFCAEHQAELLPGAEEAALSLLDLADRITHQQESGEPRR